jgi:hypothetical protein
MAQANVAAAGINHPVILFKHSWMDFEEPDILEDSARAILTARRDDVGADQAIAVAAGLAENVYQHQIREKLRPDLQRVQVLA